MTLRFTALLLLLLPAACEKASNPVQTGKTAAASAAAQSTPVITALTPGFWHTSLVADSIDLSDYPAALSKADRMLAEKLGGTAQKGAMCVSAEQARSPNATLIGGRESGACSFESFSLYRGTLDAVITCAHPGKAGRTLIAAHGPYAGDGFSLDAVVRIEPDTPYDTLKGPMPKSEKPPIRFHAKITGDHQGACPAGEDVAQ
ncbi:MAG: DUF3617 family protein [Alphaproteobacteria bacterium]|mgnify:CR=1 FL=1|jgi:hypothetical protein|nr:DUF3617 family protein [Alphaproteobacteria bacterium]